MRLGLSTSLVEDEGKAGLALGVHSDSFHGDEIKPSALPCIQTLSLHPPGMCPGVC